MPCALVCHMDSAQLLSKTLEMCDKTWPIFWAGGTQQKRVTVTVPKLCDTLASGGLPDGFEGPRNVA